MASSASAESGARPRLVWITTPVALMTGRRDVAREAVRVASSRCTSHALARSRDAASTWPAISAARRRATSSSSTCRTRRAPWTCVRACTAGSPSRWSTAGMTRARDIARDATIPPAGPTPLPDRRRHGHGPLRAARSQLRMNDTPAKTTAPADRPFVLPDYQPQERFWPYVELTEQPTPEELAALDPDLRAALYGAGGHSLLVHAGLSAVRRPRLRTGDRAGAELGRVPGGRHRRSVPRPRAFLCRPTSHGCVTCS